MGWFEHTPAQVLWWQRGRQACRTFQGQFSGAGLCAKEYITCSDLASCVLNLVNIVTSGVTVPHRLTQQCRPLQAPQWNHTLHKRASRRYECFGP